MPLPKIVTKRDLIRSVAKRWEAQYRGATGPVLDSLNRLRALDLETCSESDVTKAIGNGSWTRNACSQCGKDVDVTVMVGQAPDYESETASLCVDCVNRACWMLKEHT